MKLSPEEDRFLQHWIYDEAHYETGSGPAKRLQVEHGALPADLAVLIAAAMPDFNVEEVARQGPPTADPVCWPWSPESLRDRLREARAALAMRP
jgi:hypothetical protein